MATRQTHGRHSAPGTRRLLTSMLCPTLLALLLAGPATAQPAFDEPENTVEMVLNEIQFALQAAQAEIVDMGMPPLAEVELTLQTVHSRRRGGILKLFIFAFGKSWEKEKAQELVFTLTPPEPVTQRSARMSLAEDLKEAIVTAAEGVQKARTAEPPLVLRRLDVEIGFVVRTRGSSDIAFVIEPVTVELRGDLQKEAIQKIRLTFTDR